MEDNPKFFEDWLITVKAIFRPKPIGLLIIGGAFLYVSIKYDSISYTLNIILNILSAISIALAGSLIKEYYDNASSRSLLIKKGRSAVRNLRNINSQINQIRQWIEIFSKKKDTKRSLEEIERHLNNLVISMNNGIEDWVDVIPELEKGRENKEKQDKLVQEYVDKLIKKQNQMLSANKDERKSISDQIESLKKQIKDMKNDQYSIGTLGEGVYLPVTSGVITSSPINVTSIEDLNKNYVSLDSHIIK